jgi:hypothetical protein
MSENETKNNADSNHNETNHNETNFPKLSQFMKNDLNLDAYTKPLTKQSKFWVWIFLGIVFLIMVLIYKGSIIDKTIEPEELVASMEVSHINSQWVVSEKVDTPDFKGIIVVPEFTFRVRNIGEHDLSYVYILGVFRLIQRPKALGEAYQMAFKKTLKPGDLSDVIKLRCKFGYRASSKQAFSKHSRDWRSAMVQLYVKSGTSGLTFLKDFHVSRKIEGMDLEIKMINTPISEINEQLSKEKKK